MDTLRLVSGGRIRSFLFIVQAVSVQRSGSNIFHNGVKIAVADGLHDNFPLPGSLMHTSTRLARGAQTRKL